MGSLTSYRRVLCLAVALVALAGLSPAGAASPAGPSSDKITVWTEDFEGNPASRGVTSSQDAPALTTGSTGALTAWNLINTADATNQLTWAGPYQGDQFYYVGLDRTTKVVSGVYYTDDADTSLVINDKPIPSDLSRRHASLSFALAGSSESGYDFLNVEVKKHTDPASEYTAVATYSGQNDQLWSDANNVADPAAIHSADVTSFMGSNVDVRFHFTSDNITIDPTGFDIGWNIDLVSVSESDALAAPGAPEGLAVTAASATAVDLSWTAPASDGGSAITGYTIYRGTTFGSGVAIGSSVTPTFSDDTVTVDDTFFYAVSATNAIGEGPQSNWVTAVAADPTAPGVPENVTTVGRNSSVLLRWDAPSFNGGQPVTSYKVYRGTSSGSESLVATLGPVLAYTDTDVVPGPEYFYQVSAENSVGEGAQSAEASATLVNGNEFQNFAGPADADSSGEPTIGVNWQTGNVMMVTAGFPLLNIPPTQHVHRITFDDTGSSTTATWLDVSPPFMIGNADPILNVDPTTGRTIAGGDDGACTVLSRSDDDGQNWLPVGNSCPLAADHPTVAQGPPSADAPVQPVGALYPHVVYVCQQQSLAVCTTSNDGGNTFAPSAPVACGFTNPGIFGHLRVAPDGAAYVPFNNCATNAQGFSVSTTDGQGTWTGHPITTIHPGNGVANDPSIAVGAGDKVPGGHLYFAAHEGSTDHAVVATSTNHGDTWTDPIDLNVASAAVSGDAVGVKAITFPTAIAGDDDRAAVAFLGTKDAGSPFANTFTGVWHLYVATTYDGGATWTSVDATPTDPVQRGWICLSGIGCPLDGDGRNLLDFIDIVLDAQGHILVGYADGCTDACTLPTGTHALSNRSLATIARQSGGECLFAGKCGSASGTNLPGPVTIPAPPPPPQIIPPADTCNPDSVIFSSNSAGTPGPNSHAGVCVAEDAGAPAPTDTQWINPGSNQVQVRYIPDPGVPTIKAVLNGLGVTDQVVTLTKTTLTTGGVVWDSPDVAIDPSAAGSITAVIEKNDGTFIDRVTFHTMP